MKSTHFYFLTLLVISLFSESLYSQNCGASITLTTQNQVNNFSCSDVSGNLIIDDGGSGSINDLTPIYINGLQNGVIKGNLVIGNCPKLGSLVGLHGIASVSGNFIVNNCPNLSSTGSAVFQLSSVGGDLGFVNLPVLQDVQALGNLSTVEGNIIINTVGGTGNFKGLDNIQSGKYVEVKLNTFSQLIGLNGMQECNYLNIVENHSLTSMDAFQNLGQIVVGNGIDGWFQLANNNNIATLPSFPDLVYADKISIVNNPKLATCCSALTILTAPPSFAQVGNNASGCNSVGEVNAPPVLSSCPSNQTISTDNLSCVGTIMIADPTASDNCGFVTYTYSVQPASGAPFGGPATNGFVDTYNFPTGSNTINWEVVDESNNSDECSVTIVVIDNTDPVISNVPADVTISCDDPFPQTPNAVASDNCDSDPVLTATSSISMGGCGLGVEAEIQSFTWTATDASGNASTKNWKVTVISDFSFDLGAPVEICGSTSYNINPGNIGQSYLWSTGATSNILPVTQSGIYGLTVTSNNGCCYSDQIDITFGSEPDASATGAVLSCSAASVQISGSSTTSNVSYAWTGPGGFASNMQNPSVSAVGDYVLTVTSTPGCESTATATVTADTDVPDASAEGGLLSCAVSSIEISGSSSTSGVSYSWTGPGGFTSNMQNPMVSAAGIYTLTVLSPNGCDATATAVVETNDTPPSVSLSADDLDCSKTSTVISVSSNSTILSYNWSGPSGFSSTQASPSVMQGGTYSATITGQNGCTNTSSITIESDTAVPDIDASGGTLNCEANSTQIFSNSNVSNVSYDWTGPNNFSSNQKNPIVTQPGTYIILVTAPNGCSISTSVEVEADTDLPSVSASGGELNCVNESVTLQGSTTSSGATTTWTGPNGFTSSENNVEVTLAGTYKFTVVAQSGCESFKDVEVINNTKDPDITLFQGDLDCDLGIRTFVLNTDATDGTFEWTGPNGFTSDEQSPSYSDAGVYTVIITGTNSCTSEGSVTVASDVSYTQTITVVDNSATIEITGGTPPFIITWDNGDTGTTASNLPMGFRSVTVLDGLGCEKLYAFSVGTSSTDDLIQNVQLKLAPNPARDLLNIEWKDLALEFSSIRVLDLQGKLQITKRIDTRQKARQETTIDISSLNQGIYFIQVNDKNQSLSRKFVKM